MSHLITQSPRNYSVERRQVMQRLDTQNLALRELNRQIVHVENARSDCLQDLNMYCHFNHILDLDTISCIFLEVLQLEEGSIFSSDTPFLLGSVCRYWRSIVNSRSCFWSIITLRLSAKKMETHENLLFLWLKRSQDVKLKIYLSTPPRNHVLPSLAFSNLLCDVSKHWHTFSCSNDVYFWPLDTSVLNLQSLVDLRCSIQNDDIEFRFMNAVNLRRLSLHGSTGTPPTLNWSALEKLLWHPHDIADIFGPLFNLENIIDLQILYSDDLDNAFDYPPVAMRRTTLHKLRNLSFHGDLNYISAAIFDRINAPALKHLSIRYIDIEVHWLPSVCHFQSRSNNLHALTSLILGRVALRERQLMSFIKPLNALQYISLDDVCGFVFTERLINSMNPKLSAPNMCYLPALTHFVCRSARMDVDHNFLTDMLKTRVNWLEMEDDVRPLFNGKQLPNIACLKAFSVHYANKSWETAGDQRLRVARLAYRAEVDELRALGLDVDLKFVRNFEMYPASSDTDDDMDVEQSDSQNTSNINDDPEDESNDESQEQEQDENVPHGVSNNFGNVGYSFDNGYANCDCDEEDSGNNGDVNSESSGSESKGEGEGGGEGEENSDSEGDYDSGSVDVRDVDDEGDENEEDEDERSEDEDDGDDCDDNESEEEDYKMDCDADDEDMDEEDEEDAEETEDSDDNSLDEDQDMDEDHDMDDNNDQEEDDEEEEDEEACNENDI